MSKSKGVIKLYLQLLWKFPATRAMTTEPTQSTASSRHNAVRSTATIWEVVWWCLWAIWVVIA